MSAFAAFTINTRQCEVCVRSKSSASIPRYVQQLMEVQKTKEYGQYEGRTRDLGVISTTL